ncbi:hypothetical protein L596_023748 [Steinernema carpocapsae]|uniref:Protein sleepless n=1 Tax=Steinernema carpocapsae TaxID=34508 RepID=A0A4U5MEL0_STECR|nr:hypothetical protein L596_023748 [Steinernema carpocapsae]
MKSFLCVLICILLPMLFVQDVLALECFFESTDPEVRLKTGTENCSVTNMIFDNFCAKAVLADGNVIRGCDNELVEKDKLVQFACKKPGHSTHEIYSETADLFCCTKDLCNGAPTVNISSILCLSLLCLLFTHKLFYYSGGVGA